MVTFGSSDELEGAQFTEVNLRRAQFIGCDLSGAVLRGADVSGLEIESPWLFEGGATLVVNGVDVAPLVDAELDRRFPGREQRRATDPAGLRAAWDAVQATWAATIARAAALPEGSIDESVDGEWSFAQTLRHLVMATDVWLGRAVLRLEQPFHPLGQADASAGDWGLDLSVFTSRTPSFAEVLEARADRVAMVRDHLASVSSDELAAQRRNPWFPDRPETVLSCLHTILEEEWEHHRYAVRDLDALAARTAAGS
ncbi:DinB family protein [Terrabacter sp. NPDC080008]|uniref:DinB family protein n=1 Tax=Terrabacter sp. NPDC080008 TaxID=3155176 RepID=UPI00344E8EC9